MGNACAFETTQSSLPPAPQILICVAEFAILLISSAEYSKRLTVVPPDLIIGLNGAAVSQRVPANPAAHTHFPAEQIPFTQLPEHVSLISQLSPANPGAHLHDPVVQVPFVHLTPLHVSLQTGIRSHFPPVALVESLLQDALPPPGNPGLQST
jgi:hypothetical protein